MFKSIKRVAVKVVNFVKLIGNKIMSATSTTNEVNFKLNKEGLETEASIKSSRVTALVAIVSLVSGTALVLKGSSKAGYAMLSIGVTALTVDTGMYMYEKKCSSNATSMEYIDRKDARDHEFRMVQGVA